jgi:hypothetical protein
MAVRAMDFTALVAVNFFFRVFLLRDLGTTGFKHEKQHLALGSWLLAFGFWRVSLSSTRNFLANG